MIISIDAEKAFDKIQHPFISPQVRNKIRVPSLIITIQHSFEVLATAIRAEKEIKGIQIGKGELNSHCFQMT